MISYFFKFKFNQNELNLKKMEKIERLRSKGYKYLVHVTYQTNIEKVLKTTKTFHTYYERYKYKIQAGGIYAETDIDFDKKFELNPYEYPGLFIHLSTKELDERLSGYSTDNHYHSAPIGAGNDEHVFYEDSKASYVVFPLELLLQKNWHFKLIDKNGLIEYDTFFPENMDDIPYHHEVKDYYEKKMGYYIGNEVVFHDGLSLSNAITILNPPKGLEEEVKKECKGSIELDLTKRPNYIFYSDRRYNGVKVTYFHPEHQNKTTTEDSFYIEFIRRHLPEEYKSLCDGITTKEELERKIYETKVDDMDLFTYLHIHRL